MSNKKVFIAIGMTAITISLITSSVFASTNNGKFKGYNNNKRSAISQDKFNNKTPRVEGTVTAINGTIITITTNKFNHNSDAIQTSYTVDASNASLNKILESTVSIINISDIKVGDKLMIEGILTGTNVVATKVTDGQFGNIEKNDAPIVVGKVTAISGTSITIAKNSFGNASDSTIYNVDAANAVFNKYTPADTGSKPTPTLITIADIKVGDNLVIRGTVNGTNIVATTITNGNLGQGRIHGNR